MKLSELAQWDRKLKRLAGPHKQAFLLTVRGLLKQWNFPLFLKFDFSMDKSTFKEIIFHLHSIGLIVKLVVCDQGPKNRSLANEKNFNITPEKPFLPHPCIEDEKFYFTYDFLHLFKSTAAHVRHDEVKLPCGTIFTVKDLQYLINLADSKGFELSAAFHLRHSVLYCKMVTYRNS